jgi:hypothetical protein
VFYQLATGLAGTSYALLGLFFLQKTLERHFSRYALLLTLLCILFGTNLLHYATFEATFSHAFSFGLFAALLFLLPTWYQRPSYRTSALLALVCGLIGLVRNPNIIVWLFVPLYGITQVNDIRQRLHFFAAHKTKLLLMSGVILVVLSPQLLYWQYITGQWLLNSYQGEGFIYYLEPRIFGALFGINKGLFTWAPVLLLSLPGLWFMRHRASAYLLPTLVYMPLVTYLIASWHDQTFGSGYGHRAFVDSLPILALPLASCFDALRSKAARSSITILASALIVFSLLQTWQYWQGGINPAQPTWEEYTAILRPW